MAIIGHLDMDAFFAAIEERDHPRLQGKPIVVGADPKGGKGRGVVSTANYAARRYGIKSALPISKAWQLAEEARKKGEPRTVFMASNFTRYQESSKRVAAILKRHIAHFEAASVDEFYLDLSFLKNFETAKKIAKKIKKEILTEERLTASVGIAPNLLVAKIASDAEKPDGLTVVLPEEVEDFLAPFPIRAIPGIGPKAEQVFIKKGVRTIAEARHLGQAELQKLFGKRGEDLYYSFRGKGPVKLWNPTAPQSVGEQTTFEKDSRDPVLLLGTLHELAQTVVSRARQEGFRRYRTLVLTIRFQNFETKTVSQTVAAEDLESQEMSSKAIQLFLPFLDHRRNPGRLAIRLLGVRVEKLEM